MIYLKWLGMVFLIQFGLGFLIVVSLRLAFHGRVGSYVVWTSIGVFLWFASGVILGLGVGRITRNPHHE